MGNDWFESNTIYDNTARSTGCERASKTREESSILSLAAIEKEDHQMIYEVWKRELTDADVFALRPQDSVEPTDELGSVQYQIEADSWTDAMTQYYCLMGWGKYKE